MSSRTATCCISCSTPEPGAGRDRHRNKPVCSLCHPAFLHRPIPVKAGVDAYQKNVGNKGTDDRVTAKIGPNFSGTITAGAQPADGEIDNTTATCPPGWTLRVDNLAEDSSGVPSFKD